MEVNVQIWEIISIDLDGPFTLSQGQAGNYVVDVNPSCRSCFKTWYKWYKRTWGLDAPPFDLIRQGATQDTIYTSSQSDFDLCVVVYDSVASADVYSDTLEVDVQ